MRWLPLLTLFILGCGDGKDSDTDEDTWSDSGDCSDPEYNPFHGTCVETFLAACFDPAGSCDGEVDAMGATLLEWENGATVETQLDPDNPMSLTMVTEIHSSGGDLCATGRSQNSASGCASQTVYERPDGATQTWCFQNDGSYVVTCDDGTNVDVPAAGAGAAEACQYGSDAEACDVNVNI